MVGCVIPQLEITLVMPSQTPGKESSGCGDGESVMPDSASLGDDLHIGNSAWQTQLSLDQLKHQLTNPYGSIETPSPITNDPLSSFDGGGGGATSIVHHQPVPNTHGHNVHIISSPVHVMPPPSSAAATNAATERPTSASTASSSSSMSHQRKNRNSVSDTSFKELGSSKSRRNGCLFADLMTHVFLSFCP